LHEGDLHQAAGASRSPGEIQKEKPMLLMILLVVLLLSLGGGGWGHPRYGYASWSPAGLIVLVLVVLWLTGNLRV
jgi:hypothetical protein